jgi:hypothetical protein
MITFKQFIIENEKFDWDRFTKDCSYVLQEMKGNRGRKFLYHGTPNPPNSYDIRPFKARERSRDTNQVVHKYLNAVFQDMFGWPIRSGLFTTGRMSDAAIYTGGFPVCAIFPIGKFDWVCGLDDDLHDLNGFINRTEAKIMDADTTGKIDDNARQKLVCQFIGNKVRHMKWLSNEDLPRCLGSENEIMIKGTEFYFFNTSSNLWEKEVEPKLKEIL